MFHPLFEWWVNQMTPEEKAAKKEAAALKRKEKLANVSEDTQKGCPPEGSVFPTGRVVFQYRSVHKTHVL